jgi:GPH family glycoside/pentoside/hexuronide:cation symporter
MSENKELPIIFHSKKNMASFNTASIAIELIQGVLSLLIIFFYVAELGLNPLLAALGVTIYAVYDAFNDPLVGYFTDRPFRWTKKLGRRFPFIAIFFFPMIFCFLLVFSPPSAIQGSQLGLFGWLVFSTCLFDTVESFFTVNYWALGPDKFRDQNERRILSSFEVYLGFIGVILAFVVPPMIIDFGNISSYAFMAWICVGISIAVWFLMYVGIRDDQETVEHFLVSYEKQKKESFFKSVKSVLSHKNYMAYLFLYILYQAMVQIILASMYFHTRFVLRADPEIIALIILAFFFGGLISLPLWIRWTNKTQDNRKTWIMSATFMAITAAPLTLMVDLTGVLIVVFLYGLAFGGFWVMITPVFSDVIDESVVLSDKRRESTYGGFRQFFLNLARVIQGLTLGIMLTLTGFVEGAGPEKQPASALFGIQLTFGIIPAIYIAIGVLIFWKYYDITPEKVKENKAKLAQLKL